MQKRNKYDKPPEYWKRYAPQKHSKAYWKSKYEPKKHSKEYYQEKYLNGGEPTPERKPYPNPTYNEDIKDAADPRVWHQLRRGDVILIVISLLLIAIFKTITQL